MIKSSSQSAAPRQLKNMNQAQTLTVGLELLSLSEVAEMLRMSRASIYRMIARRALSFYRVGRRMRFQKGDILEYLERNRYGSEEG